MQRDGYRDDKSISISKIKDFKFKSPKKWYSIHMENNVDLDKNENNFIFGSLLDCLLFTPQFLEERFYVADFKLPSDTIKEIVDCIYAEIARRNEVLKELEDQLPDTTYLEYDLEANVDLVMQCINKIGWNSNWKDETRFNSILKQGNEYFNILAESIGRKVISAKMNMQAIELQEILSSDPIVKNYFVAEDNVELLYQLELFDKYIYTYENKTYEIPIKGALDILKIDHKKKTIQVVDFKTAASAFNFVENIKKYGYCEQLSFYNYLVRLWMQNHGYKESEWLILPPINIVIDTNDKTPFVYEYSWDDLKIARHGNRGLLISIFGDNYPEAKVKLGWQHILEDIGWHMSTGNWETSREMYLNGKIKLNLYSI